MLLAHVVRNTLNRAKEIHSKADLDDEVKRWLKKAYELDA